MDYVNTQRSTIIFGFDSAWAGKEPGAICAIAFDDGGRVQFHEPRPASFPYALAFIKERRREFAVSLVAIDQPTIVPNATGSRPVECIVRPLMGFVGSAVQPANRGKRNMFGDCAPIWLFLSELNAIQDPIKARTAGTGHFLIEVYPALSLLALKDDFAERNGCPKYNPEKRKKFRLDDWRAVAAVVQANANEFGVSDLADWACQMQALAAPRKCHQDLLDAAICALIGLMWRAGPSNCSAMRGDLENGYMVTPISNATRGCSGLEES